MLNLKQAQTEAAQAAAHVRSQWRNAQPRLALVLGSGWGAVAEAIENPQRLPYAQLAGFPQSAVQGHASDLVWGRLGGHEVLVLTGRKHTYETGEPIGMCVPLMTAQLLGCEVLVQTNAAGSLDGQMPAGSLMLLSDHINLSQRSPLIGVGGNERFVSMADAYDPGLRQQVTAIACKEAQTLYEGAYAWYVGPQFETPAEIRMAALVGARAVGMSTVPETIWARYLGLRVLALSLITNMGAGLSSEQLSHAHTLEQAQRASQQASGFLTMAIGQLVIGSGV